MPYMAVLMVICLFSMATVTGRPVYHPPPLPFVQTWSCCVKGVYMRFSVCYLYLFIHVISSHDRSFNSTSPVLACQLTSTTPPTPLLGGEDCFFLFVFPSFFPPFFFACQHPQSRNCSQGPDYLSLTSDNMILIYFTN